MEQAKQLFSDYRYYRQYTSNVQRLRQKHPYLQEMKATPARLQLFKEMAAWCKAKGFDARLWLYSLFVSRKWLYAPKLDTSHLTSEKHIPKFKRLSDFEMFKQRQREEKALKDLSDPDVYDPNRDLSNSSETAKRYYLGGPGGPQECMAVMMTETFGFHPKSKVCGQCPAWEECGNKLQASVRFDIMALRRGEITSEQARSQALARSQSYGN